MLKVSIRRADFNEIKVENLSKAPIVDTLEQFWQKGHNDYLVFLEANQISYYKNPSSNAELLSMANSDIRAINSIIERNNHQFDYKITNMLSKKWFREIHESEFFKLTIDLSEVNNPSDKDAIKDLFLETKSASIIDCAEINDDFCSLIYHKKGAIYYHDNPILSNSREAISMLENFKAPKDSNFIMARFLYDLACKLDNHKIHESFYAKVNDYEHNHSIQSIIHWGSISEDEKNELKENIKTNKTIESEAYALAKKEMKSQAQTTRDSLNSHQAKEALENDKSVMLYNITDFQKMQEAENANNTKSDSEKITEIVNRSIELYRKKEIEKLHIKLDKAKQDSNSAYKDLKDYLNNGLTLLEAFKNLQQKYRNEDTVNFASLLFSQDILNLRNKELIIENLNKDKDELKQECANLYDEIDKHKGTIEKLRSTLTTKLNEMRNFEYEVQKNFEEKLQARENELLKELESYQKEQKGIISDYEKEINELDSMLEAKESELKALKDSNATISAQNNALQDEIKNTQSKLKDLYKLEAKAELYSEREEMYKNQIAQLEAKNQSLETRIDGILNSITKNEKAESKDSPQNIPTKKVRSKDILGSV